MRYPFALLLVLALPGCATIVNGSGQSLTVETDPSGADCKVSREGELLGEVAATPGSLRIEKSKNDVSVTCVKNGYQSATVAQSPQFSGATFGNLVVGGLIGAGVDAATGANYTYPSNIHLSLATVPPGTNATPAALSALGTDRGAQIMQMQIDQPAPQPAMTGEEASAISKRHLEGDTRPQPAPVSASSTSE